MKRLISIFGVAALLAMAASAGPLQDMINAATNDAVIMVPAGTYNESISLKEGQALVSEAGPEATIIDGQNGIVTVTCGKDAALIGFTVRGGQIGVYNAGNFIGVFECIVTNYASTGMLMEKGSAAIMNNLITGNRAGTGIACKESNPYVGFNVIAFNKAGFSVEKYLIPTLDHNVFLSNEVAVVSADGTQVVMTGNIFDGNGQNVVGIPMGTNDVVCGATAEELKLRRGMKVEAYRELMERVFAAAVSMQPRIIYDLSDEPGKFNLIVTYPYATFTVSASARDTVIKSFDAYDRNTDSSLNAQFLMVAGGYPSVAVVNPQLVEKDYDRYVLEKIFEHLPSYYNTPDGKRVFSRLTNLPRIEVLLPAGWKAEECNIPVASVEQRGARLCVKMFSMGMSQIKMVMGKTVAAP